MSLDGGGSIDLGVWAPWSLGEGSEISAEELVRVREDMQKAAQMGAQIAGATQQNKQYAQLLILLLQHITEDKLISHIFRQLTEFKLSIPAIFSQFLPFLHGKVHLNVTTGPFLQLIQQAPTMSKDIAGVVAWYRGVFQTFPGFLQCGDSYLQHLVIDVAQQMHCIDLSTFDDAARNELFASVKKELGV